MRGGKINLSSNICSACNQNFPNYGALRNHKTQCTALSPTTSTQITEPEPTETLEETDEIILNNWGNVLSKCLILPSDANFSFVHLFVSDPHDTILALDFDQTITTKPDANNQNDINSHLRGGAKSREALQKLFDSGVLMMIITAQPPSEVAARNLKFELEKLKIEEYFGLENWSRQPVYDLIKSWGPNENLPMDLLEKKLAALIVLNTNRFGKDLARFGGAKRITFKEDLSEVYFYLQSMEEPSPLQWSGKQTIKRNRRPEEVSEKDKEKGNIQYFDSDLCVILAWKEYLSRTQALRSVSPDEVDIPERLFVRPSPDESISTGVPLTYQETIALVRSVFEEAGIKKKHIKSVCENPCKILLSPTSGAQIITYGNTYCSKYNKAEAMELFMMRKKAKNRKTVIFVDDNSDNVWNIFEHFAMKEKKLDGNTEDSVKATSCWFTPPLKSESIQEFLLRRLRVLHTKNSNLIYQ